MLRLSVVVPTYNEADHIKAFLGEVAAALHGIDHEILVVDDNSPDGTHDRVASVAARDPRVVPILRTTERGLATAVIEGIRRAKGEWIVVMDSDFQHPPPTVPNLLEAAQNGDLDLVVASRYAPGGSQTGFPLVRRVISWGAKTLAVVALPRVRKFRIRDPMSGFFLIRRSALDPETLRPVGYKILIEILARADIHAAGEVGFAFKTRRAGESKLRIVTQWDYFRHVVGLGLRDPENRRAFAFAFVGATGIVVNYAVYATAKLPLTAKDTIWLLLPASIAREASILWNFWWNDLITFRDLRERAHAGFWLRVGRFNLVSLVSWAAYLGLFSALVFAGVNDFLAIFVAILLTFLLNYQGNRRWTYAERTRAPPA